MARSSLYPAFLALRAVVGVVVLPVVVVLAAWPTPGKYPWGVPLGALLVLLVAQHRYRVERDDFGAALLVAAAVCLSAGLTAAHWLGAGFGTALLVGAALLALPAVLLVMSVILSGSADDPGEEP